MGSADGLCAAATWDWFFGTPCDTAHGVLGTLLHGHGIPFRCTDRTRKYEEETRASTHLFAGTMDKICTGDNLESISTSFPSSNLSSSSSILSSMGMDCSADTSVTSSSPTTSHEYLALGDSYYVDEEYEQAAAAYTAAVEAATLERSSIVSFRGLSHRSAAYFSLKKYSLALQDAQAAHAILNDGGKHKIPLRNGELETCWFREGQAALALGRIEYARAAFESAQQTAIANRREFWKYQKQLVLCDERIHAELRMEESHMKSNGPEDCEPSHAATPSAPAPAPMPSPTPAPEERSNDNLLAMVPKYQYYQSDKFVTVQILEPRVQASDLTVRFQTDHLTVTLVKAGRCWTIICGNLYDDILVDRCRTVIKDEKIVLKLAKANVSYEWPELLSKKKIGESKSGNTTAATSDAVPESADAPLLASDAPSQASHTATQSSAPSSAPTRPKPYASSKDWNKIEKDILQQVEDDSDPTNRLFQTIYANADEDTKRAMIKSYQTSGGTVLSTNWKEVKDADYEKERIAPKGMEWKNWKGDKLKMKEDD